MNLERICHVDQWTAENYTSELLRDFALCRGLWLDKILLGLTLFWILPPECHIMNLMVHPKFWGRGLGRYLMQDLLDICKSRKTTKIALEVREGNIRAETLYLHLGFFCSGLRRGYYSDGSNAKNMTLKLTNPVETIKSVYISPSLNSPRRKS
ncbi:MAG: GNAT family N-acetyltransferase [Deltaproteobacteria bacterium]|nr:GNAT family N-acetyltransferase [Deltaproteobacteria bacterium]